MHILSCQDILKSDITSRHHTRIGGYAPSTNPQLITLSLSWATLQTKVVIFSSMDLLFAVIANGWKILNSFLVNKCAASSVRPIVEDIYTTQEWRFWRAEDAIGHSEIGMSGYVALVERAEAGSFDFCFWEKSWHLRSTSTITICEYQCRATAPTIRSDVDLFT